MSQTILPTPAICRAPLKQDPKDAKKGDLQGRSATLANMRSDLDSFLGKGSLAFQQFQQAFTPEVKRPEPIVKPAASVTPVLEIKETSNFQGRKVTIQRMKADLACFLGKGSLFFHQGIDKFKAVFTKGSKQTELVIEQPETIKEPLTPLPVVDAAYLSLKDSAYNLKRLSEMSIENAIESVCSEEAFKMVPTNNAMNLGYDDATEYQTMLGNQAIVAQIGATALAILGISTGNIFTCLMSNKYSKTQHCLGYTAQIWQETHGKVFLAVSAIFLAASIYAHNKGWLGALLHDRSLGSRQKHIETLFRDAAKELSIQGKTNPEEAKKTATKILRNAELIETTLHMDLALPSTKAKGIVEALRQECDNILNPEFPNITTEELPQAKEMKL